MQTKEKIAAPFVVTFSHIQPSFSFLALKMKRVLHQFKASIKQVLNSCCYCYRWDGVTLCLCGTASANWPFAHLPGDTSVNMVQSGMILTGENRMTER
jgi:hypothetical protein